MLRYIASTFISSPPMLCLCFGYVNAIYVCLYTFLPLSKYLSVQKFRLLSAFSMCVCACAFALIRNFVYSGTFFWQNINKRKEWKREKKNWQQFRLIYEAAAASEVRERDELVSFVPQKGRNISWYVHIVSNAGSFASCAVYIRYVHIIRVQGSSNDEWLTNKRKAN